MRKFILKPDITLHEGVQVFKDTELEYKNDNVTQKLKNLTLKSKLKQEGHNYTSTSNIEIRLSAGDILLFNEERGYFLPNLPLSTIDNALTDIEVLKDLEY